MLPKIVTHYAPWPTEPDNFSLCGVYVDQDKYHSPQPTCPDCARKLAEDEALEQAIDETPWPLDADEAATELEREATNRMSPLGAQLFNLAVTLNKVYAAQLRKRGSR